MSHFRFIFGNFHERQRFLQAYPDPHAFAPHRLCSFERRPFISAKMPQGQ
jgi:hypothetical protein